MRCDDAINEAYRRVGGVMRISDERKALTEALRPFVEAFERTTDPGESDLDNEQPRIVRVTLGDCRRALRVLRQVEV